jgi:hypothetical protein
VGFGVGSDGADGVPREAMEGGLVQVGVCGWVGLGCGGSGWGWTSRRPGLRCCMPLRVGRWGRRMPVVVCLSIMRYYYRFVLCTRDKSFSYAPMVSSYGNLGNFREVYFFARRARYLQTQSGSMYEIISPKHRLTVSRACLCLYMLIVYVVVVRHAQAMLEHCLGHPPRLTGTGLLCDTFLLGRDPDTARSTWPRIMREM